MKEVNIIHSITFTSLQVRTYLQTRYQNYSQNSDTYLKTNSGEKKNNFDRYTAPRSLTTTQQFQLLLLDLEPQFILAPLWQPLPDAREWLEHCQSLIDKVTQVKAESDWWFTGIFKTKDLEEFISTLKSLLTYKITQLYRLFWLDEQMIRRFIKEIPQGMFFQYQILLPSLEQKISLKKKHRYPLPDLPNFQVSNDNQFKYLLDDYITFELHEVQKFTQEAAINREVFTQDLKTIATNIHQNLRSNNQVNIQTQLQAGILTFDLQLTAMGWLTAIKEESQHLSKKTIQFLRFTAPLTASIGSLLLLLYLLGLL